MYCRQVKKTLNDQKALLVQSQNIQISLIVNALTLYNVLLSIELSPQQVGIARELCLALAFPQYLEPDKEILHILQKDFDIHFGTSLFIVGRQRIGTKNRFVQKVNCIMKVMEDLPSSNLHRIWLEEVKKIPFLDYDNFTNVIINEINKSHNSVIAT